MTTTESFSLSSCIFNIQAHHNTHNDFNFNFVLDKIQFIPISIMGSHKNLKGKVLKGSIVLTIRQLLTAGLSLVSFFIIARILGPKQYGIVTLVLGIFYFVVWTGRLGLNTYLVRQPNLPKDGLAQIVAFYNTVGIALCILLWFSTPLAGWWTGEPKVTIGLQWLIPAVWLDMVGLAAIGMLERDLKFAEVGLIEGVAKVVNYSISIPWVLLADSSSGYLGPLLGTFTEFAFKAAFTSYFQPIPLQLRWRWSFLKPALTYGLTYSGSDLILNLRTLRVPILVSRLVSVEAVGITNMAIRLVEQLSLLRLVMRRMSISVISKLIHDPKATRDAISKGMAYQALMIGPLCAGFAVCAAWVIPVMFDEKWLLSAQIFPLIALGMVVSAIFDLHIATLYAAGHNREVAKVNISYVSALWITCFGLIGLIQVWNPDYAIWGYGLSEIMALPCFFLIHRSFSKFCGAPDYRLAFWLILAALPSLLGGPLLQPLLTYVGLSGMHYTVWYLSVGVCLFLVSYGLVFTMNGPLRQLSLELWKTWRSRNQKQLG